MGHDILIGLFLTMKRHFPARRVFFGFFILALAMLPGLLAPAHVGAAETASFVREIKDIPYWQGQAADPVRHRLDLYLPRAKKDFPVVVFVHGGAWVMGDKSFFGWGPALGRYYAAHGIGVVMPSYRLSPGVKHPEHVKDLARAFAWTVKEIGRYGGRPDQLFLCGHSAGGHLVSLLATDENYLKAEGVKPSQVKGVIAVGGVYHIPEINVRLKIPSLAEATFRSLGDPAKGNKKTARSSTSGELDLVLNPFGPIFGNDPKVLRSASPFHHVHARLPPFLLIYSDHDLPLLPEMAREFARALTDCKCDVQTLKVSGRDHETVMFYATFDTDPVAQAICTFVARHTTGKPAP
jgi:acetyl esterase/lipase